MKKFIFIFLLLIISLNTSAQVRVSAYFDGYWSSWTDPGVEIKGNYDGFIMYVKSEGPWNYRFKFTIDNFSVPNKRQRKKDIKANYWYEYSGTVEYYISDEFPSVLEIFRYHKGAIFSPAKLKNGRPTKKIVSKATIKIAPFKKLPKTYNIWFDDVAFGISLGTGSFPDVKFD